MTSDDRGADADRGRVGGGQDGEVAGNQKILAPRSHVVLHVNLRTPSKNDIKATPGAHGWHRQRRVAKDWAQMMRSPSPDERAAVTATHGWVRSLHVVVWLWRERSYDVLNLYAGLNPIVDVMRDKGWLVNDSKRWLPDVQAREEQLPDLVHGVRENRTRIVVRDLHLQRLPTRRRA